MNPNAQFERDLEQWLQSEAPATAPAGLHAAVIDRARTRRQRPGWMTTVPGRWFGRNRGLTLLAVGALLLAGGAMAAGSGLVKLPSLVPPEPAPSLAAVLPPSPDIETPTPGPTASPSPAPTEAPVPVPPKAPSWAATGDMTTPRSDFAAVALLDGMVLVVGGSDGNKNLASAELYDPATGTWTATGSMVSHAGFFTYLGRMTATLLRDGKVLVAGGFNGNVDLASAELYDPATGTWTATGSMLTPRAGHSATLLSDGRVLVTGGLSGHKEGDFLASAELYDPATGTWTATGSLGTARANHTATLLSDGRVLVAGGVWSVAPDTGSLLTSAELYDPVTGTWTYARSTWSWQHGRAPIALPDGRVLVGGSPELYDPATRSWAAAGGKAIGWFNGPAVLLANGGVLALGAAKPGEDEPTTTAAYLFDPGSGSWTPAGKTAVHRSDFTATLLPDGRVLVAGGKDADAKDPGAALASAELFDPGTWSPSPVAPATPAPTPTPYAAQPAGSMFAYLRQDGRVWVANGDGTGAHELLPDLVGYHPGAPAWSPDGTRLVFSMTPDGNHDGMSRLYLTDAAGTEPQLVDTGCVAPCVRDTDAAFSSDGTKLVFVRTITVPPASTELIGGSGKAAGDREASVIATVDLSTGQVTELASTTMKDCPLLPGQKQPGVPNCGGFADHSPRWSPDGTQIVFSQDVPYDGNGPATKDINGMPPPPHWPPSAIFVVDADGGNLHRVAQCCSSADWSPDGSRIVFDSWPRAVLTINPGRGNGYTFVDEVNWAIYSVRPDGTDQQRLTPDKGSGAPTFTADGRIWFARGGHLWLMDADGANATQVGVSPEESLYQPYGRPPRP